MIIANVFKMINLGGEQTYFNEERMGYVGGDNFPHLLQGQAGCEINTLKWSSVFWGVKRTSHSTDKLGVSAALGKLESSDSNESF